MQKYIIILPCPCERHILFHCFHPSTCNLKMNLSGFVFCHERFNMGCTWFFPVCLLCFPIFLDFLLSQAVNFQFHRKFLYFEGNPEPSALFFNLSQIHSKYVYETCAGLLSGTVDIWLERSYVPTNELLHNRTRCTYPSYILGIIPLPWKPVNHSQESFGTR